ncbi:MAG: ABC transporter permease [Actinobacteria bacterium]|nr:ABC transporter permease [Actinomycetota bacterium]
MAASALHYLEREVLIYRRLWRGVVFSQIVQPVLYLLAMGIGLGGLIEAAGNRVGDLSYLQFVAPGLMAATVVQNATAESLWPVMAGTKWMRFYHGMVASPMRAADVYYGNLMGLALRFSMAATAFLLVATLVGAIQSPFAILAIPAAVGGAIALAAPLTAFAATQETDKAFPLVLRFITLPMFLFSATFFPLSQLPPLLQSLAWVSPLWHSVELCRSATTGQWGPGGGDGRGRARAGAGVVHHGRLRVGHAHLHQTAGDMKTAQAPTIPRRPGWTRLLPGASMAPPLRLVERNIVAWRGMWLTFLSVLIEPILFLFSIGIGVGALVGDVILASGESVPYRNFVAAALLATSSMMGPVFDSTFNFFVKLKYIKTYQATLATPMRPRDIVSGELMWSLVRAGIYATAFLVTMSIMGLIESWWAVLSLPVSVLIGFAFAGAGLGATTFMRSFVDFDYVNLAIVPMFLFSATFFPLSRYPEGLQWIIQITPLYQGVVLERALVFGDVSVWLLVPMAYLVVMGAGGLWVASRRLGALLLP